MADVLVDTCVWIDFLRGARSEWAGELRRLLGAARVVVCGMVVLELLQGIRTQRDRETFRQTVSGLSYVEVTIRTWTQSGWLGSELNRKGRAIPSSDLVVATLAIEHGLALATFDTHFDRIAGLRRHRIADPVQ